MAKHGEQKPLTVAFVLPSFAGGGAERVVLNLIAGLNRDKVRPELVVLDGRGPLSSLVPTDTPIHDLGSPRLRYGFRALVGQLRRVEPDIVISSFGYVNVALLALRSWLPARTRVFVREANLPSLSLPEARWPSFMSLAYRAFYPRADVILCTSKRMADEFTGRFHVSETNIRLLPNPVDVAALRAATAHAIRASGPGVRFAAAGRLTRQKGFDRLIDLFVNMPPDARLEILGEGPEQETLRARAEKLGLGPRIRFHGFVPTPWPHYAGADTFLLPARWEGMPNAALEALACGTPVIATPESGGIREIAPELRSGAVRVENFGEDFLAAMTSVKPASAPDQLRPSLLPSRFERSEVCRQLEDILLEKI